MSMWRGGTDNTATGLDFTTIKYSPSGNKNGSEENSQVASGSFELYQNYPNPSSNETVIKYFLPESADVTLVITNPLGLVVKEIYYNNLIQGMYSFDLNTEALAEGFYLYSIITKNFKDTKQLAIIH